MKHLYVVYDRLSFDLASPDLIIEIFGSLPSINISVNRKNFTQYFHKVLDVLIPS